MVTVNTGAANGQTGGIIGDARCHMHVRRSGRGGDGGGASSK